MARRLRRALARLGVGLGLGLGLALALYLGAAVLLGLLPTPGDGAPARDGIEIAVTSNLFHTEMILPMAAADIDWADRCPPASGDAAADAIAFGWGDRGFYLETRRWADLRVTTALRALLFSSDVLMHVTCVGEVSRIAERQRITISPDAYRRLAGYIGASFRRDEAGRPIRRPEPGYGPHDAFYAAVGTYSPFQTCNEWLAAGLRQAGIRTGWWAPFAFGVTAHL
jgi:uncharacterized protein (TIGR02117 family)